jgi:YD repeat-containing protein
MCERGFHFCQKLKDVFKYYQTPEKIDDILIVYEVEALGEIETHGAKSVTDRIRIVSVVDPQDYAHLIYKHEYDKRGNLIKTILPNGNIYSYEYDDRGNKTKEIHPNGDTYSYEYDQRGNLIKKVYPDGTVVEYETYPDFKVTVEKCDTGSISDGYHTFDELYDHRHALYLAILKLHPEGSWISRKHHDDTEWEGWFIAGMTLPTGSITYHLPDSLWALALKTDVEVLENAPEWDGHTPNDVVERLLHFVKRQS